MAPANLFSPISHHTSCSYSFTSLFVFLPQSEKPFFLCKVNMAGFGRHWWLFPKIPFLGNKKLFSTEHSAAQIKSYMPILPFVWDVVMWLCSGYWDVGNLQAISRKVLNRKRCSLLCLFLLRCLCVSSQLGPWNESHELSWEEQDSRQLGPWWSNYCHTRPGPPTSGFRSLHRREK